MTYAPTKRCLKIRLEFALIALFSHSFGIEVTTVNPLLSTPSQIRTPPIDQP